MVDKMSRNVIFPSEGSVYSKVFRSGSFWAFLSSYLPMIKGVKMDRIVKMEALQEETLEADFSLIRDTMINPTPPLPLISFVLYYIIITQQVKKIKLSCM